MIIFSNARKVESIPLNSADFRPVATPGGSSRATNVTRHTAAPTPALVTGLAGVVDGVVGGLLGSSS